MTTTEGVDEDEELEASYHQQFPSYSSLFDDLDKTTMEIDDTAQVDLPSEYSDSPAGFNPVQQLLLNALVVMLIPSARHTI